jgi:Peptidase family M28
MPAFVNTFLAKWCRWASAELQETTVVTGHWGVPYRVAKVGNILAKLKGTGQGKAVLLASHYDSVSTGPGAGDNAVGLAGFFSNESERGSIEEYLPNRDNGFLKSAAPAIAARGAHHLAASSAYHLDIRGCHNA